MKSSPLHYAVNALRLSSFHGKPLICYKETVIPAAISVNNPFLGEPQVIACLPAGVVPG
jgi:hypothetical protein